MTTSRRRLSARFSRTTSSGQNTAESRDDVERHKHCKRELEAFDTLPTRIKQAVEAKPFRVTARYCAERLEDGKTEEQVLAYIAGIKTSTNYVEGTNIEAAALLQSRGAKVR